MEARPAPTSNTQKSRHRRGLVAALALGSLATSWATACKPAPPPPTIVVNATGGAHDIDPGDGICESAPGNLRCSVQAAMDEANAHPVATVVLPPAPTVDLDDRPLDIVVTGNITVRAQRNTTDEPNAIGPLHIEVAPDATLVLDGPDLGVGTIDVQGTLAASKTFMWTSVTIGPTGRGIFANAVSAAISAANFTNSGTLDIRWSSIGKGNGVPAVDTRAGGHTSMGASAIFQLGTAGPSCLGTPPVSAGHNAVVSDGCALSGPGDRLLPPEELLRELDAGSVRLDAVPPGTLGCGSTVTTDWRQGSGSRPTDGNGDGLQACDIGAIERPAP